MDFYRCPVCGEATELHESPLAAMSEAFSEYVQCQECGSSSHPDGFDPVDGDEVA